MGHGCVCYFCHRFPHSMNALHKGNMSGERVFNPHFNIPSGGCSTDCIVCQCVTEACGCPTDEYYLVGVCSLLCLCLYLYDMI